MSQFRLIGLVLFITAIFLTLAAGLTQTSHIRLKRPSPRNVATEDSTATGNASVGEVSTGGSTAEQPSSVEQAATQSQRPQVEFMSIPIIWPLIVAGGMGLVIWFSLAPRSPTKPPRRRRRRRRK